jgi:integrase
MAGVREIKTTGKWEVAVRHKDLPSGRKFFTFDSEPEARAWAARWEARIAQGKGIPQELLDVAPQWHGRALGTLLRAWMASGKPAATELPVLSLLFEEVGGLAVAAFDYRWVEKWVTHMKVRQNLAPGTIRKRVGALSHAIDYWARMHPSDKLVNHLKSLQRGYSSYTADDRLQVEAAGGGRVAKVDERRDLRLDPEIEQRCMKALESRPAMRMLFQLIRWTGVRLKEAYTLTHSQVDLQKKVIRFRKSKQWHGKVAFKEVPIRRELYPALEAYLRDRPGLPGALVFPWLDEKGTEKRTTEYLSGAFGDLFEEVGAPEFREHDLRHEATCCWFELRAPDGSWMLHDKEINRIMGWSENSQMASRYASFRGKDLAQRMWAAG